MERKILLTGGGTAGHVIPNLALLPGLRAREFTIAYIGGKDGMEKRLAEQAGLPYHGISTGKLRRYASVKNLTDPFRVIKGLGEAVALIKKLKPTVVFSKGGFVSVPVVMAAKLCGVKCILHESDMTPGLANKLTIPFAKRICATFPETLAHLPKKKAVLTGAPIRRALFEGSKQAGLQFCGFQPAKPVLLVMGGSQGSVIVNNAVRAALPTLTRRYNVAHLCGKGNLDEASAAPGYAQYEFISQEMPDLLAAADIVVSRAGSNAINELLALHKPMLLIPLSLRASRGDQILNAESFRKQGFADVLTEEELTTDSLLQAIETLDSNRLQAIEAMAASKLTDGVEEVLRVIEEVAKMSEKH